MTTPTLPTIHLNGTSGEALVKQFADNCTAVREALLTVCRNGPHMRDYYVAGSEAYRRADEEHRARVAVLEAMAAEFEAMALALLQEMDDRRAPV
jgi:hypothetical protein